MKKTNKSTEMISFTETLTLIHINRRRKSRFELPSNLLREAYDKVKWISTVTPEPLTESEFLENVEVAAELWIKREIEKNMMNVSPKLAVVFSPVAR